MTGARALPTRTATPSSTWPAPSATSTPTPTRTADRGRRSRYLRPARDALGPAGPAPSAGDVEQCEGRGYGERGTDWQVKLLTVSPDTVESLSSRQGVSKSCASPGRASPPPGSIGSLTHPPGGGGVGP